LLDSYESFLGVIWFWVEATLLPVFFPRFKGAGHRISFLKRVRCSDKVLAATDSGAICISPIIFQRFEPSMFELISENKEVSIQKFSFIQRLDSKGENIHSRQRFLIE